MFTRSLKRFAQRSRADQGAVLQAILLVGVIRLALCILPFRVVQRTALQAARKPDAGHPVSRIVWAVKTASRYLPGATCLAQGFAAYVLLAWSGHKSRVEIGVALDEQSRFKAHAWVICQEEIVIGGPADRYTPLATLEAGT